MSLNLITCVSGRAVPMPGDNVDTDQIIPARFLKSITFDGLGPNVFYDQRFDADGKAKAHPLNDEAFQGASILLVGSNFGCGSSREHAPQALHRFGVRAIIGVSFGEIFLGNATTLGIPCACVSAQVLRTLIQKVESQPSQSIDIDVDNEQITMGTERFPAQIARSAREALLSGQWDPISLLLSNPEAVEVVAQKRGYMD